MESFFLYKIYIFNNFAYLKFTNIPITANILI